MAMLGRYRRRIATAAFSALVTHPTSGPAIQQPLVSDVGQVVRLCSLAVQVCGWKKGEGGRSTVGVGGGECGWVGVFLNAVQ